MCQATAVGDVPAALAPMDLNDGLGGENEEHDRRPSIERALCSDAIHSGSAKMRASGGGQFDKTLKGTID